MNEAKNTTAAHVLSFKVQVVGSAEPSLVFGTREAAQDEAVRLRRDGREVVVRPVHRPLPSDPWLGIPQEPRRRVR